MFSVWDLCHSFKTTMGFTWISHKHNYLPENDYSETNTSQFSTHSFEILHELHVQCSNL